MSPEYVYKKYRMMTIKNRAMLIAWGILHVPQISLMLILSLIKGIALVLLEMSEWLLENTPSMTWFSRPMWHQPLTNSNRKERLRAHKVLRSFYKNNRS